MKQTNMKRREFVGAALSSSVLLLTGSSPSAPQSRLADARIDVLLNEPVGTIADYIGVGNSTATGTVPEIYFQLSYGVKNHHDTFAVSQFH